MPFIIIESITGAGSRKPKILCNSCVDVKVPQDSSTDVADASDRYGCIQISMSAVEKIWYQFLSNLWVFCGFMHFADNKELLICVNVK